MAQIYLLSRGIKGDVDRMIKELSSQYLPVHYKEGSKNDGRADIVQVSVRPVQLWEIVVGERQVQTILNTIKPHSPRKLDKLLTEPLRMALRAKKMPKTDLTVPRLPIFNSKWVQWIPIGIREDKFDPETGQEML